MLSELEQARLRVSKATDATKKTQLGQFFTPSRIASFMAGLFPPGEGSCHLLDAGAGIGSLTAAFLDRWQAGELLFDRVSVDAFEIDSSLHRQLTRTFKQYRSDIFSAVLHGEDFIHAAVESLSQGLFGRSLAKYTHVILNPPYKKISSRSEHRLALRRVGIETVNLYSAFLALAVAQTTAGGHIVAIIPRSFCNGPYYRPFRDFLLEHTAIRHIHLFGSRTKAFEDDAVLQENVIIHLEKGGLQGPVSVSNSSDDTFSDIVTHECPFDRIVFPDDAERFIHVPTSPNRTKVELSPAIKYTLADLGINVSTGPVVDFRVKEYLSSMPHAQTVPLLYPAHFKAGCLNWPVPDMKKPNAIVRNADTEKWLYPNGYYCVVRRFSSKEEPRRISAHTVDPNKFQNVTALGFENHLNVIHEGKSGLPKSLAYGLAMYLNSTIVDEAFRRFNGHTQVNATDLKGMKFPSRKVLTAIGEWALELEDVTPNMIDERLGVLAK